ncbi:DUF2125 domain-containing protein [Niveispirillum sp. KHB5.9]|uniref:DUF2125 domain-containing protein n=1 Tax=Niveispirillum sp. KHB5.9 TaxID=3400269 RepID=UPI003A8A95B6
MLSRYRPLFLALSVMILLLLAYTAYWAAAAWRLSKALAEASGKAAEKNVELTLDHPAVAGFPLRLTVNLSGLRAQWPSGTLVEAGPLTLSAWAWSPLDITLETVAPLRLDLAGSARHAPASGTATGLTGRAELGLDGKPRLVSATLTGVRAQTDAPLAAAEVVVSWTAPAQAPEGPTDPQGRIDLLVRDLDLPGAVPPPLKPRIDQLALSYEARGPLPAKPSVEGMTAWRDGGGTLEIPGARLLWSGMDLRANATLALDGAMQPAGKGTAELSGAETLIDMLVENGSLRPEQAEGAKAGMTMLGRRTDDGRSVLSVPILLKNSQLFLGPLHVATLPPIPWN